MRNYVQPGQTVTVTAPAGGVKSGDGVLIGSLYGVAATDAAAGAQVEIATVGIFDLPKTAGAAIAVGDRAYWDAAEGEVTPSSDTGNNKRIGVAVAAAADAAVIARVRLDGAAN